MFYKPKSGGMWDPSVYYYDGYYYMASMYFKEEKELRNDYMLLARSKDGVHWEEIGPVIEDRFGICKMFLYETEDAIVANFGSFASYEKLHNDTIRYYKSKDMINWEYIGKNSPDDKWYWPTGRWDHMYVYKEEVGGKLKYYGYPVATPYPKHNSSWGICVSDNGYDWKICEPPIIEWGPIPHINCLEGGGMEKVGDKYYYIGGMVGYANNYGYGVYTFIADSPMGPFKPDLEAFRLCGFDRLAGRVFVQNLASFARDENGDLLITNAVDAGGSREICLLPFKKGLVDSGGHLRQAYWPGNERAKGKRISLERGDFLLTYCQYQEGSKLPDDTYKPSKFIGFSDGFEANTDTPATPNVIDRNMLVLINKELDLEKGIILEGKLRASSYLPYDQINHATICWRPASFGIFLEEEVGGMDIILEIAHPYKRYSHVENIRIEGDSFKREIIDTIGEGSANLRGIDPDCDYSFKLLYRRNIFELYVDDIHVQTFVQLGKETGRIGFTLQNAWAKVYNIKLYEMDF